MTNRWFVFREDSKLGPFDAVELRRLLREGTIDPFDFVCREDSSVKRELIEVDEIFETDEAVSEGFVPAVGQPFEFGAIPPHPGMQAKTEGPSASGSPIKKLASPRSGRRRDQKRYYLLDRKKRVLGPLSPGEIQSLFHKGVLDGQALVMKNEAGMRVPVARFVAAYSERAIARGLRPELRENVGGLPSSPVLQQMAFARQVVAAQKPRNFSLIAVLGLCLLAAIAGVVVWKLTSGNDIISQQKAPHSRTNPLARPVQRKLLRPKSMRQKPKTDTSAKTKPRPAAKTQKKIRSKPKAVAPAKPKPRPKVKPKPKSKSKPKPVVRSKPQPKPKPKPVARPRSVAVPPRAAPRATQKPKPALPAPQSVQPRPQLTEGQIATLSSMSYSVAAVESCNGLCSLDFSGAVGKIQVKFFKQVYGPKLIARGGKATIKGRIGRSGGSVTLLLQGVQ